MQENLPNGKTGRDAICRNRKHVGHIGEHCESAGIQGIPYTEAETNCELEEMNTNKYKELELLNEVLAGNIPESDAEFQKWLMESENFNEFRVLNGLYAPQDVDDALKDKIYSNITEILGFKTRSRLINRPVIISALSLCAILVVAFSFIWNGKSSDLEFIADDFLDENETLAEVRLCSASSETVSLTGDFVKINKDGTVVIGKQDNSLAFRTTSEVKKNKSIQQKIIVPKGKTCVVTLSDGSTVTMNSGSRMIFPSYFDGKTRIVQLDGEAFFNVEKDGSPFIVKSSDFDIEVLGTEFNLCNYYCDPVADVTLNSGSVKVSTSSSEFVLQPNDHFRLDRRTHKVSQTKTEAYLYSSWANGEYVFKGQTLDNIFMRLSKWYDFNVVYETPEIKAMRFTGSFMKDNDLTYLMNQITSVAKLKYQIDGNTITLSNNN